MIEVNIDGQKLQCEEGESILEVARKNNIYLPAICYLTGCSPTVACKMCMVEMDGKRVYGCNAKAKNNAKILTHTKEIQADRKAIMQSYGVNHPLECGVCDKSGECELQDLTLRMQVDIQPYDVADDPKLEDRWAKAVYDPNLCILCERCVTTCKDNIGEANLKAVKTDLHSPEKYKDTMPKEPYSVWSRKQKAVIGFVGESPCFDCGECISVCPVGALGYGDFSYTANAWELQKISSTCQHCPAGCFINYEVRHQDIDGKIPKIYRVSNNFNHNPICGTARFAFDVSSSIEGSDNLTQAKDALKNAKALKISGSITNEEAYIIENLRQKLGFKLFCEDTRLFQEFANTLSQEKIYKLSDIQESDLIITLGSAIKTESPHIRYTINNTLKMNKSTSFIYAHPIEDKLIDRLSRNILKIHYAPNADEIMVGAMLLSLDLQPQNALDPILQTKKMYDKTITKEVKKTIEEEGGTKEVTEKVDEIIQVPYYEIFEKIGLNEATYNKFSELLKGSNSPVLIIGQDLYKHKNAKNIANLLSYIAKNTKIKIILIPPETNSVGISLICSLDKEDLEEKNIVGIRCEGDFTIDSDKLNAKDNTKEKVDFILPALNQIEGTITNFEHRVLVLKSALPYEGYDLCDIAQGFGFSGENLTQYTHLLPLKAGFKNIAFDKLQNFFTNAGEDKRGYILDMPQKEYSPEFKPIELVNIEKFNAYLKYPQSQFSTTTKRSSNLQTKVGIYTSKNNLENLNLKDGDTISLLKDNQEIQGKIYLDYDLNQDIFVISPCLDKQNVFKHNLFENLTLKECQ